LIRKSIAAGLLLTMLTGVPGTALAAESTTPNPTDPATAPAAPGSSLMPTAPAALPSWPGSGGGPSRNSTTADALGPALYVRWKVDLDAASLTTPVVAAGRAYTGTFAGTVYALDAQTGRQIWSFRPNLDGFSKVRGLAYADGRLYLTGSTTAGNALVALDVSGEGEPSQLWQATLPDWSASSPLVAGGVVVAGCNDGTLVAYDQATGAERWRQQFSGDFWRANQAASGQTLVALSYMGKVAAFDLITGQSLWSQSLGGYFEPGASPVIDGDTVYVASSQDWTGKVAAYDLTTGQQRWAYQTSRQDNLWMTPVVSRGRVIAPLQGAVYTLDAATGSLLAAPTDLDVYKENRRTYRPTLHTPVVGKDVLWLPATFEVNGPQRLYTLGAESGAVVTPSVWVSALPARLGSGLAYAGGVLYFTGQDNRLYAMSSPAVKVEGESVAFPDVPAHFSDAGRFMVPLRFILESMGATVDWIQETRTVVVHRGDTVIEMKQGSRDVTVNGQVRTMDTEVTAVGGRTVVPLRFLTDWLGGSLDWDQPTLTATLHLPQ